MRTSFGLLEGIKDLQKVTDDQEEKDLISDDTLTDAQKRDINTVSVPSLNDQYVPQGAAGNAPAETEPVEAQMGACDDDAEPQTDGLGGGMSFKSEMSMTEGFTGDEPVDESGMKTANDGLTQNVMDDVKDRFAQMFGTSYTEMAKNPVYDIDTTEPNVIIEEPARLKNIKKGW